MTRGIDQEQRVIMGGLARRRLSELMVLLVLIRGLELYGRADKSSKLRAEVVDNLVARLDEFGVR
jgi:hypothetical protein